MKNVLERIIPVLPEIARANDAITILKLLEEHVDKDVYQAARDQIGRRLANELPKTATLLRSVIDADIGRLEAGEVFIASDVVEFALSAGDQSSLFRGTIQSVDARAGTCVVQVNERSSYVVKLSGCKASPSNLAELRDLMKLLHRFVHS